MAGPDARLAAKLGESERSKSSARGALALLDDEKPDFGRQPDLGHIDGDRRTVRSVKRLAAGR